MSKYTTEVRYICETYAGLDKSEGQASVNDIISKSVGKVFDFDFPIYDESYRNVLETKILKHYYTREICCETVGLWKHFLDMRMNEIMPYYNQLYKSALLNFNPLYDTDYTVKSDRGTKEDENTVGHAVRTDDLHHSDVENATRTDNLNESETTANTRTDNLSQQENGRVERSDNLAHHETVSGNSNSKDKYSDTPQGALANVENDAYLTNARIISDSNSTTTDGTNTGTQTTANNNTVTNTGTQTNDETRNKSNTGTQKNDVTRNETDSGTQKNDTDNTREFTSTDDYLEHVAGKRNGMSYSKMVMEYRETFLNIDMMIINNLSDLFFNLW